MIRDLRIRFTIYAGLIGTKILLRGDDVPLEAGDTVEIHP